MSKNVLWILAALAVSAAPAFAQNACMEPAAPAPVDGTAVTQPQLMAARAAALDFISKSDLYQQCMTDDLNAQKTAAIKNQTPFDPAVQNDITARVDANQKAKEKVGADINSAIGAFKKAHTN